MKNTLNIGSIKLPKASATKGFGFIGKRGSGKSYGAAVFAEELYAASIPFVVFDPIDVWWGLKVAADGKGKGLPIVVFGKEHADIQLDRTMGKRIAEAVVRDNISCIISTFGMNKTEMREVVADFSERLLQLNNTPRQVIIEEAHEFVPQRVMGAGARCFSAVEALLVMGRNRGIGVTLLNQRMATLNKDLLTQIDVLVAFRSVGPQDRKAFKDWVEVHNEENDEHFNTFMKSVPSLPTGEAWVWSPEFLEAFDRIKFRKRETFHPDREKLGMTFKMPEIKQGDVQSFIESFNKKPDKPAIKVVGWGGKPVKVETAMGVSQWMNYGAKYGYDKFFENRIIEKRDKQWIKVVDGWSNHVQKLHRAIKDIVLALPNPSLTEGKLPTRTPDKEVAPTYTPDPVETRKAHKWIEEGDASGISKSEQKILNAIAWFNAIGNHAPRKEAVALIAGVRPTSGGYKNDLGRLRSKSMLDYPEPNYVAMTDLGKQTAHEVKLDISGNEAFHREVLSKLKGPEQNVLRPLLDDWREMPKDELAGLTPYEPTSGGYKNILGTLRTMGLIDYPRPGYVKAEPLMFPFGA